MEVFTSVPPSEVAARSRLRSFQTSQYFVIIIYRTNEWIAGGNIYEQSLLTLHLKLGIQNGEGLLFVKTQ